MSKVTTPVLQEFRDYDWSRRAYGVGTGDGIRAVLYDLHRPGGFGMHVDAGIHQFSWAVDDTLSAYVGDQHWLLPPARGVWVPAGTPHDVALLEPGRLVCVYVNAELARIDHDEPSAVQVDALLRGLVEHLLEPLSEEEGTRAQRVFLDALSRRWQRQRSIVLPRDPRARRVARHFLDRPDLDLTLDEVARRAGVSERTLRRRFLAETRLTPQQWLIACRVHSSLALLLRGEPIADVARSVGYASASAYIAAFKAEMGTTPARFREQGEGEFLSARPPRAPDL